MNMEYAHPHQKMLLTIGPSLEEDGLTLCLSLLRPSLLDRCLVSLEYCSQVMVTGEDVVGSLLSQASGINRLQLAHKRRIEWALTGHHCVEVLSVIVAPDYVLGTAEVDLMFAARMHCNDGAHGLCLLSKVGSSRLVSCRI